MRQLAAAGLALLTFYAVGYFALDGYALDLGSVNAPTPRYVLFVMCWAVLGSLTAKALAATLSSGWPSPNQIETLWERWKSIPERTFLRWMCGAAFTIPFLLRLLVLQGAPLTDDEGAYRFAAQLLASGRLWVPSPEMKLFFDQVFMINDGRLYPVYFLGWPALLAIGELAHAPGVVNPILSALTVPALFEVLKYFSGVAWARAGILLFLSSPFLQIAAATQLSHTACLMALTWGLAMYVRTTSPHASIGSHAGLAFFLALAFCIRPQSTVGIAAPLVVSWAMSLPKLERRMRVRAAMAFLLPSTFLAALFLGVLWAQNGSPWLVGYARYNQYIAENGFRFTGFGPTDMTAVPGFDTKIGPAIGTTASGLFRLNFDLFGWRSSFAFILLGLPALLRKARLLWAMLGIHLLILFFQRDWGVDTFGPVHAFELSLPILLLTIIAANDLTGRFPLAPQNSEARPKRMSFPPFLFTALIVSAWLGFVPVRLRAVYQISSQLNIALRAPAEAGLHRAVIFSALPFAPPCRGVPNHFVFFRPVNDPDLRNDVLWVNHIDIESDRRLMETLPGRTGYLMRWTPACEVTLSPLSSETAQLQRR